MPKTIVLLNPQKASMCHLINLDATNKTIWMQQTKYLMNFANYLFSSQFVNIKVLMCNLKFQSHFLSYNIFSLVQCFSFSFFSQEEKNMSLLFLLRIKGYQQCHPKYGLHPRENKFHTINKSQTEATMGIMAHQQ